MRTIFHWHIHSVIHTHPFNGPLSGTTQVSRYQKGKNQSGFYWSERQWVAMASAGPYASLHLAPDRQLRQHPTTQFFTGRMPFLPPNQQRQSTEGNHSVIHVPKFIGIEQLLWKLSMVYFLATHYTIIRKMTHHLGLHHPHLELGVLHGHIHQWKGRLQATQISVFDNRHSLSAHSWTLPGSEAASAFSTASKPKHCLPLYKIVQKSYKIPYWFTYWIKICFLKIQN